MRHSSWQCKSPVGHFGICKARRTPCRPDSCESHCPSSSPTNFFLQEFLTKCRDSKELISAQIPWASAGAERSRAERALELARIRSMHGSHQDLPSPDDASNQLTIEEKLLATLLEANEALVGVLLMYDDLARIAIENATEERSIREVKMPKGVRRYSFSISPGYTDCYLKSNWMTNSLSVWVPSPSLQGLLRLFHHHLRPLDNNSKCPSLCHRQITLCLEYHLITIRKQLRRHYWPLHTHSALVPLLKLYCIPVHLHPIDYSGLQDITPQWERSHCRMVWNLSTMRLTVRKKYSHPFGRVQRHLESDEWSTTLMVSQVSLYL